MILGRSNHLKILSPSTLLLSLRPFPLNIGNKNLRFKEVFLLRMNAAGQLRLVCRLLIFNSDRQTWLLVPATKRSLIKLGAFCKQKKKKPLIPKGNFLTLNLSCGSNISKAVSADFFVCHLNRNKTKKIRNV